MPVEIVTLEPLSDGDPNSKPPDGWVLVDPPHIYLSKIAEQWLENKAARSPGVKYYLNKLPSGYRLFERARPGNPKITDKHLYGHPKGRYFDSPNRFYPHFEHLMKHGNNVGCPCTVCNSNSVQALPISNGPKKSAASSTSREPGSVPVDLNTKPSSPDHKTQVDEEGTPDTVSRLLDKLKLGPLDEEITEPSSMDWTASKDVMREWINHINLQPSWMPRQGELVLFVRSLSGTQIDYDRSDGTYKIFDEMTNAFAQLPPWEAGVIAQDANELVNEADLMKESDGKERNITYSGFRIEPLHAANEHVKSATKGHKYIPLHHIRPFVFWRKYLAGHPEDTWHPTILSAMKVMSSICLIDKHRLRGTWPNADIFCSGLYIGSEFLCLGDTAILVPPSRDVVHDFLKIDTIRLRLTNLDQSSDSDIDARNFYSSTIILRGKAFTLDRSKGWDTTPITPMMFKGLIGYERDFYWLHDPSKSMEIPFACILGRCYDANSMLMWFPPSIEESEPTNVLNYSLEGVRNARDYSSSHDDRIIPGKTWFWGDNRLEILGLDALNNVYASYYDDLREEKLEEWRYHTNKKKAGRPPKFAKNPMAVGVARALAVSGSENENDGLSAEDDNHKKRNFDVAMSNEAKDQENGVMLDAERKEANDESFQSGSKTSTTDENALERFKKPRIVVVLDD